MSNTRSSAMDLSQYLETAWRHYLDLTPSAKRLAELLAARGEILRNDHIALRTFNHDNCNKEVIAAPFLKAGYRLGGEYVFREKKLKAIHLEHQDDPQLPKIFISELVLEQCHPSLALVFEECEEFLPGQFNFQTLAHVKRPWPAQIEEYHDLMAHSEYAAWLYALGFRANHFTLDMGALHAGESLQDFNQWLRQHGFVLNESGGEIKGSPKQFLEQSSTMADLCAIAFSDGEEIIPTCYIEFARRYPDTNGKLYQGFLEQSANFIFESTHARSEG